MRKILIVEDESDIAENIAEFIVSQDVSLKPEIERDGYAAFSKLATDDTIALAILDIGLPGMDGVTLCRRLRGIGWTNPVIMLTARDTVEDRVRGLESGADDYLVKPFALRELYARIRVQLRRSEMCFPQNVLRVADLSVNQQTMTAMRAGQKIKLTNIALKMLVLLMKRSPAVVSREEMMSEVWKHQVSNETVRAHMYLLRNAVDKQFGKPLITTLSNIGWVIKDPDEE